MADVSFSPLVYRLYGNRSKVMLFEHLKRLSPDDRRLRFFSGISDAGIKAYVDRLDVDERDFLFGASVNEGELIAAVHVAAFGDGEAELAVSVDEAHRRRGLAQQLFERALLYVQARGFKTLYVNCLAQNVAMQRLVKKYEATVTSEDGTKLGTLLLAAQPDPLTLQRLAAEDAIAVFDLALRPWTRQLWTALRTGTLVGRG